MEATINFIMGNSPVARYLRQHFVSKIVTMLNRDGVYDGSTLTSLTEVDMSRVWSKPASQLSPTFWHSKQLIRQLIASRKVSCYVGMHDHSTKRGIFMYAVEPKGSRKLGDIYGVMAFPRLCAGSAHGKDMFFYESCSPKVVTQCNTHCAQPLNLQPNF